MEDLLAASLQCLDEAGEAGLAAFLAEHPEQRADLEAHLDALRESGLLLRESGSTETAPGGELGGGEYLLGERLGGGGMGVVHRAHQRSLQRDVAVKLIRPDRLHQPAARARFQREAAALAGLHHPGILPVYASGEDDGQPWFAMELVDGRNLDELREHFTGRQPATLRAADVAAWLGLDLRTGAAGPWRPQQRWHELVAEWGAQAAAALHAAHLQGVVHRDVKPSNLMLSRTGRLLLFDFGLTTSTRTEDLRLTRSESPVGSPVYMAPEQIRGTAGDPRSDLYALGVTLYELLALDLPFSLEGGSQALREQILAGVRIPLRHRNRRVPADLEVVVETAMAHAPQHRYADAGALEQDLRRCLRGEVIQARRPGPLRQLQRAARRRPARALALVLAFVVVVGGPGLYGWQQARARRLVEAERAVAERNLDTAIRSTERFLSEFGGDHLAYDVAFDARGQALLADAVEMFEDLHTERPGDARIRGALAGALRRSAWQARRRGAFDEAAELAARSVALLDLPIDDVELLASRVHAVRVAARIERLRERPAEAERSLRDILEETASFDAASASAPLLLHNRARARADLGRLLEERGAAPQAVTELRQSLDDFRAALADAAPRSDLSVQQEAHILGCLGRAELQAGRRAEAMATQRAKLALVESIAEPMSPGLQAERIEALDQLSRFLHNDGEAAAARDLRERACALADALVEAQPQIVGFRERAIIVHLAAAWDAQEGSAARQRHLDTAAALGRVSGLSDRRLAGVAAEIARCRFEEDRSEERRAALLDALVAMEQECGAAVRQDEAVELSKGHQTLAVYWYRRDPLRAEQHAARARDVLAPLIRTSGSSRVVERALSFALSSRALALSDTGRLQAASEDFVAALELQEGLLEVAPHDGELWYTRAGTLCNAGMNANLRGQAQLARDHAAAAVAAGRRSIELGASAARVERLMHCMLLDAELTMHSGDLQAAEQRARSMLELEGVEPVLTAAGLLALFAARSEDDADRVRRRAAALDAVEEAVQRGLDDPRRLFEHPRLGDLRREKRFLQAVYAARDAGRNR